MVISSAEIVFGNAGRFVGTEANRRIESVRITGVLRFEATGLGTSRVPRSDSGPSKGTVDRRPELRRHHLDSAGELHADSRSALEAREGQSRSEVRDVEAIAASTRPGFPCRIQPVTLASSE